MISNSKFLYNFPEQPVDIGHGKFSYIYEVVRAADKIPFVAKMVKDPKKFKHPNIVTLEHIIKENDKISYLVYEKLDFTLKDYVLQQNPTLTMVLSMSCQIVSAMEELHSHKIIHLDLHNRNIMIKIIDGRPTAYIIDLGISETTFDIMVKQGEYSRASESDSIPPWVKPSDPISVIKCNQTDVRSFGKILSFMINNSLGPKDAKDQTIMKQLTRIADECQSDFKENVPEFSSLSLQLRKLGDSILPTMAKRTKVHTSVKIGTKSVELQPSDHYGSQEFSLESITDYVSNIPHRLSTSSVYDVMWWWDQFNPIGYSKYVNWRSHPLLYPSLMERMSITPFWLLSNVVTILLQQYIPMACIYTLWFTGVTFHLVQSIGYLVFSKRKYYMFAIMSTSRKVMDAIYQTFILYSFIMFLCLRLPPMLALINIYSFVCSVLDYYLKQQKAVDRVTSIRCAIGEVAAKVHHALHPDDGTAQYFYKRDYQFPQHEMILIASIAILLSYHTYEIFVVQPSITLYNIIY
eukprot:gene2343-2660_t